MTTFPQVKIKMQKNKQKINRFIIRLSAHQQVIKSIQAAISETQKYILSEIENEYSVEFYEELTSIAKNEIEQIKKNLILV